MHAIHQDNLPRRRTRWWHQPQRCRLHHLLWRGLLLLLHLADDRLADWRLLLLLLLGCRL
jgi:hypothetical protein